MFRILSSPRAAGVIGCFALLLTGWSGLLVPSLIRSIERDFSQSDSGLGVFYLVFGLACASGSAGGGVATERIGRRRVLAIAAVSHGLGVVTFGVAPNWTVFLAAALPAGLGFGALGGGINGLILDLYPGSRGRALNTLHLFSSLGALAAPLIVGQLVDGGVVWQGVMVATAAMTVPIAGLFAKSRLPHGRHSAGPPIPSRKRGSMVRQRPLLALGFAIACYVGAEVGVSDWLVRFLEEAPLRLATTSLSLFWAGLTLGRLVAARFGARFDLLRFTAVSVTVASFALLAAVIAPSVPTSIILFALAGFAFGPVFPTIVAVGGARFPDRSAAVSGLLISAAVVGAIAYPPLMGFLSVHIGLPAAMMGTGLLGLVCAGSLLIANRL